MLLGFSNVFGQIVVNWVNGMRSMNTTPLSIGLFISDLHPG
jgi:hypothetical protein